ncbi:hypothetical protein ABVK25_004883 [Lepraria finkii]|uniref:Uncharacterized protein n=1 Tax=Lepraria finkii TaxID=1340010 RepID=A0ABR4B9P9_9LECA
MANAVKTALAELFADVSKSKSGLQRLLKPSPDGAGSRVFPSKTTKNDGRYGVRIDKGEPVEGKQNTIRLKMQINSNATNKTLEGFTALPPKPPCRQPYRAEFLNFKILYAQASPFQQKPLLSNPYKPQHGYSTLPAHRPYRTTSIIT